MAERRGRFHPEQNSSIQPLRGMDARGRNRFGISAPSRPGGVIAPDRPTPTPTLPRPDKQPEKPLEKGKRKHSGLNTALIGGGFTLVAGGLAYATVPEVNRFVDSVFLDHLKGNWLLSDPSTVNSEESPSFFDSSADKQIAKVGVNARAIPDDEALVLAKENPPQLYEGDFPTLPLIFIGKLNNGGEAVIETDYTDQAYNPIAQKPDRINSGKEITFTKAGTEIALTLPEFEVFQVDPFIHKDKPYFAGLVLRFKDPDGIQYIMSIEAPEDLRHLEPTEIIKNAPTVGEKGKYLGNKHYEKIKDQKGLIVQGPISILRTTENNTKVRIGAAPDIEEYPSNSNRDLPAKILFIIQDNQLVFPQ